jgi:hypothetical protein
VLALALLLPAAVLADPGVDGQTIEITSEVTHSVYGNSTSSDGSGAPNQTYPSKNTVWITTNGKVSGSGVFGGYIFANGLGDVTVENNKVLVDYGGMVNVTGTGSVFGGYVYKTDSAGTIATGNQVEAENGGQMAATGNIYGGYARGFINQYCVSNCFFLAEENYVKATGENSTVTGQDIYGGYAYVRDGGPPPCQRRPSHGRRRR